MRAEDLDEAIDLADDTPFGLTSGIQSLDDREVDRWVERIQAGNLYVNRPTTGAIVGRQPFGGWKASSMGPGAKAGGPNYVLQLARWRQVTLPAGDAECSPRVAAALTYCLEEMSDDAEAAAVLQASAASYAAAWRGHFAREHDPSALLGEDNVFRYRPCRRIIARGDASPPAQRLALLQTVLAALTADVPLTLSLPHGEAWPWLEAHAGVTAVIESEAQLMERLRSGGVERLRVLGPVSLDVRAAAHRAGVTVIDAPAMATGRLELRWYLREQTVSRVRHRYGNVIEPAGTE
jgi:RHH-type proline utilization regulon transcriptional repressor/proline dehydrogenase/delta 1-pyrroline-5-carboxylate dehydrogenase